MGALERFLLLQIIDERWREHLFDMDYLREGIHLRGFAQIDPLVAYKNEAFTLFGDLMNSVWADYARMIFNVEVNVEGRTAAVRRCRRSRPRAAPPARGASPTRAGRAPRAPERSPRPPPRAASSSRETAGLRRGGMQPQAFRWSNSASSTRSTRSGATTRAGAGAVRSSSAATAPSGHGVGAARRPRFRQQDPRGGGDVQALRPVCGCVRPA